MRASGLGGQVGCCPCLRSHTRSSNAAAIQVQGLQRDADPASWPSSPPPPPPAHSGHSGPPAALQQRGPGGQPGGAAVHVLHRHEAHDYEQVKPLHDVHGRHAPQLAGVHALVHRALQGAAGQGGRGAGSGRAGLGAGGGEREAARWCQASSTAGCQLEPGRPASRLGILLRARGAGQGAGPAGAARAWPGAQARGSAGGQAGVWPAQRTDRLAGR
jgi:hypothetical protein